MSANCPPGSNPNRQTSHGLQGGCYDVIRLGRVEPNPTLDFSAWRQLQAYFVKMGLQQRVLDPNACVDDTYVTRALEILGRE